MKTKEEIEAAYKVFLEAIQTIPKHEISRDERLQMAGAADALNWLLNQNEEMGRQFDRNIELIRARTRQRMN